MKNLLGDEIQDNLIKVNIYADEVMNKECPYTRNKWHYIGIIVEDCSNPLLNDIIAERYCHNFDKESPYYEKNNKIVHWTDIDSADVQNIVKRWFKYILNPVASEKRFYSYIFGINSSLLNSVEFDNNQVFNSEYNRFFRIAVKYALKCFFPGKSITIKNIYHEVGQQQIHKYFPWHVIYKLRADESENFSFENDDIVFLEKDHNKDQKANIIQLCDCLLGASVNLLDGVEQSNHSEYRKELLDMYLPLFEQMIDNPSDKRSEYKYANRIMIRFFPREKTMPDDYKRLTTSFYTKREIKYLDDTSGQIKLL